jgi:hypothetical protein
MATGSRNMTLTQMALTPMSKQEPCPVVCSKLFSLSTRLACTTLHLCAFLLHFPHSVSGLYHTRERPLQEKYTRSADGDAFVFSFRRAFCADPGTIPMLNTYCCRDFSVRGLSFSPYSPQCWKAGFPLSPFPHRFSGQPLSPSPHRFSGQPLSPSPHCFSGQPLSPFPQYICSLNTFAVNDSIQDERLFTHAHRSTKT